MERGYMQKDSWVPQLLRTQMALARLVVEGVRVVWWDDLGLFLLAFMTMHVSQVSSHDGTFTSCASCLGLVASCTATTVPSGFLVLVDGASHSFKGLVSVGVAHQNSCYFY